MTSYERLEFIGDAILDFRGFLITISYEHILKHLGHSGDPPYLRSGQRSQPGSTNFAKGSVSFSVSMA